MCLQHLKKAHLVLHCCCLTEHCSCTIYAFFNIDSWRLCGLHLLEGVPILFCMASQEVLLLPYNSVFAARVSTDHVSM